jgi:hypothetical protein
MSITIAWLESGSNISALVVVVIGENDIGDTPILSKQDILPNYLLNKELKDCSTQTNFAYTSIEEMYSILCEKCGHKVDRL